MAPRALLQPIITVLIAVAFLAGIPQLGGGSAGLARAQAVDPIYFDRFAEGPPVLLGYSESDSEFRVDQSIDPLEPVVFRPVDSFAIDPALPAGLNFDTNSGLISGTPTATSSLTVYTVTATNVLGSAETDISITVLPAVACDGSIVDGVCWWFGANNESCDTVCSDHGGYNEATRSFAGSDGNNNNCKAVLTALAVPGGTTDPTAQSTLGGVSGLGCGSDFTSEATSYRLTSTTTSSASSASSGSLFFRRACACNEQPAPNSVSYAGSPFSFGKDIVIAPLVPSTDGFVSLFDIAPDLPIGLDLDTETGVISGTPLATSSSQLYTVTASNAAGSVQTSISIEIVVQAPDNLAYPLAAYVFSADEPIAPQSPTHTGSDAISFSIDSPLPTGLTFNTATGTISGTPTVVTAATDHTVTVSNEAGSDTVTISIEVTGPFTCDGEAVGGFCWYFGTNNQSCDDVCVTHGGYSEGTRTFAGSDGNNDNCKAVLTALPVSNGTGNPIAQATLGGVSGLGCGSDYTDNATSYRLTSATTSSASSAGNGSLYFRRACACNE